MVIVRLIIGNIFKIFIYILCRYINGASQVAQW